MNESQRAKIVSGFTAAANRMKHNGHNAFALYLEALERAEEEIASGTPIRAAILNNFNDRIADMCLRACGMPEMSAHERV